MNSFLQYSGESKQRESHLGSGRYYARFSQAETDLKSRSKGPASMWVLEAFDAQWFDNNQPPESRESQTIYAYYQRAVLFVLEILYVPELASHFRPLNPIEPTVEEDGEVSNWFFLQAGPVLAPGAEGEVAAMMVYSNLYALGTLVAVREVGQVSSDTRVRLNRAVDTDGFPDATEDQVTTALSKLSRRKLDWAVVYDVGQGGSNGFCRALGPVEGYFDLGGGVLRNLFTFPSTLRNFCFTENPPIILSHWDWDHWSSANRDPNALTVDWIAPRQPVGPIHLTLMSSIAVQGRLLLLPSNFPARWRGQIYLERCTGAGRNHSGVSLTFSEHKEGRGNLMLFPGDARYSAIPSFDPKKYLSVVSPHHGADMGSALAPFCAGGIVPRLVHSFGQGNSYSHPRPVTRQRYAAAGWVDPNLTPGVLPYQVRQTADRNTTTGLGHVLLAWRNFTACPPSPCGYRCQLSPQQL